METGEAKTKRKVEFAGWKADRDGILIGFRTASGEMHALAMSIEQAERTIPALAAAIEKAKALVNDLPGNGVTCEFAMKVEEASFGTEPSTDDVFARMKLRSGGSLGFTMPRKMARGLGQALIAQADMPPQPMPVRN